MKISRRGLFGWFAGTTVAAPAVAITVAAAHENPPRMYYHAAQWTPEELDILIRRSRSPGYITYDRPRLAAR